MYHTRPPFGRIYGSIFVTPVHIAALTHVILIFTEAEPHTHGNRSMYQLPWTHRMLMGIANAHHKAPIPFSKGSMGHMRLKCRMEESKGSLTASSNLQQWRRAGNSKQFPK